MDYSTAIEEARRKSSRRRSSAWAAVPEEVLGIPLSPITPATFDLLHGTGNAFVCGGVPTIADVRNFILFHSRGFNPDEPTARFLPRFKIRLRTDRALCPLFTATKKRASVTAANLVRAIHEIREIVSATWAEALPSNDEADSGPSVAAALHAQLADMFAREYQTWPCPRPIRHTPIAQLFQLARCVDRHHLGKSAVYYDRDEANLLRDFLRDANADRIAQAQQQAQASQQTAEENT